jgi:uncharacterized membrane protein YhaH (DUF805 family)
MMWTLSIWHYILIATVFVPAIVLAFAKPRAGRNRFGSAPKSKTFTGALAICLAKYANFDARASRSEYWWFAVLFFVLAISERIVGETFGPGLVKFVVGETLSIAYLALALPLLAVTARRLHDRNMSGWWLLAGFGIGAFVLWYKLAQPAKPEADVAEEF